MSATCTSFTEDEALFIVVLTSKMYIVYLNTGIFSQILNNSILSYISDFIQQKQCSGFQSSIIIGGPVGKNQISLGGMNHIH